MSAIQNNIRTTSTAGTFSNATPALAANLSHKAFDLITLIDKLPLQIECMTCYDNMLILGTSCGRLLIYEVKINELTPSKFELDLKKSIPPTKKPIQQLESIRSFDILIAMFDSQLHVFDLDKFQLQYSINKTKGCTLFATSISNDQKLLRLCVACKKKLQFYYVNILSQKTSQFMELVSDLELNDTPRNLKLTKDNLVVFSLRKDYYYYELPTTSATVNSAGTLKQPETRFSTGTRQIDPLCEKLHNEFFALGVDENKTIIYDTKGKPFLEYPILWSNSPSTVCSVGPYLIGVLPSLNCLEVVTIQPSSASVQLIEFNRESTVPAANSEPRSSSSFSSSFLGQAITTPVYAVTNTVSNLTGSIISNASSNSADRIKILKSNYYSVCYVATQSFVWCLIPIKINDQLEQIIRYKNYELGLNLISTQLNFSQKNECPFSKSWPPPSPLSSAKNNTPSKSSNILAPFFSYSPLESELNETIQRRIKNLHALDLFCKKRFEESLHLFQLMKTDPSHIIAFLPGLLPDTYRSKLKFDEYYPILDAKELEEAINKLIDYLQFKRNEFLKDATRQPADDTTFQLIPLMEGKPVIKTRQKILIIIDTTLLKCYLKTKENLVPFFLRREQNFLDFGESERLLLQHSKMNELTILYEKKEEHEKALNLLLSESKKTSSTLHGMKHMVEYLKKIGNKRIDLIFKYAKNVIEADFNWGIKIFMGDCERVDEKLIKLVEKKQKNLIMKRKSLSSIKSVIGHNADDLNGTTALSTLLNINNKNLKDNDDDKSKNSIGTHYFDDDEDDERLKALNHEQVYTFLNEQIEPKQLSINVVRMYLQYCVFVWKEKSPNLNNLLIESYVSFIESIEETKPFSTKQFKQMLIFFLTETNTYEPSYALSKLSFENYPEERAIVLGKMGKHSEALNIYVNMLNDTDKAEAYCQHVYANNKPESQQVYYELLQTYLKSEYEEIRIGASIRLLNAHSNEIGSCRSLELLPAELMKCKNLSPFFESMLNRLERNKHNVQIVNRLMFSLELQIHETKIMCQDKKFLVNDEQMCKECNKRMGKSAMVRFPNGDLIHYGCSKNSESFLKRATNS